MKKYIIGILIVLLIIGVVVTVLIVNNNGNEENEGTTTIQLNEVTRSVFYAPQYVAIANRIF